jgi:hypothetical protein
LSNADDVWGGDGDKWWRAEWERHYLWGGDGGEWRCVQLVFDSLWESHGGERGRLFNGSAFMFGAGAVTVASGGVLNLGDLFLFGPLTNSGTINITNARSSISMYNSGMTGAQGGVINQAGGLIDFVSDQTGIGGNVAAMIISSTRVGSSKVPAPA